MIRTTRSSRSPVLSLGALLFALATSAGCAHHVRAMVRHAVLARGEALREWQAGNESRILLREGNRIVLYRILGRFTRGWDAAHAEPVYAVDLMLGACFAGTLATTLVPCERMARDPEIGAYAAQAAADRPAAQ